MKTLFVFCEGETEQLFCDQVLFPHLAPRGFSFLRTILVANSKHKGVVHRGGVRRYAPLHRDLKNQLGSRKGPGDFVTTMIDLYALPEDFPGKAQSRRDPDNPVAFVEKLEVEFGKDIPDPRFLPYFQLHEFETLLFSDPEAFRQCFESGEALDRQIQAIHEVVASSPSIEHINDGYPTSPSRRISQIFPEYRKTLGPTIAASIGLDLMRQKSPHFGAWLERLENLEPLGEEAL